MKQKQKGNIAMIIGAVLIVSALVLTIYNVGDSMRAGRVSREALDILIDEIGKNLAEDADETTDVQWKWIEGAKIIPEMTTEEIDGNAYIGFVEVPSKGISLPVMADWDYDKLKIAPCVYSGSYYTDDLILAGHNYTSHFGPLTRIGLGEDVYLVTVDGQRIHYIVDYVQTLKDTAIEQMKDDTDWDLTLFTCTLGGQTRCTVRCIRVE